MHELRAYPKESSPFAPQEFQWLEFYAGVGNLTKAMKGRGLRSLRFDIIDNTQPAHRKSNYMNLLHSSGWASLVLTWKVSILSPATKKHTTWKNKNIVIIFTYFQKGAYGGCFMVSCTKRHGLYLMRLVFADRITQHIFCPQLPTTFVLATKPFPDATRLALLSCLRAVAGNFGAHVGIKCSSFCKMNIVTSMRSACATIGHALFESVSLSNALLERTILNLAQKLKNICYCQLVHGSRCSSQIRFSKTPFPYRARVWTSFALLAGLCFSWPWWRAWEGCGH